MDTGIIRATEDEALQFHASGRPGKLSIAPTKPLTTQRDLALAYSPGVAFPCLHIERQPSTAFDYTSKGNFVAVISNGTAVLGLGDLGALAAKPVMEGKCALFKRFADIDFDRSRDRYPRRRRVRQLRALSAPGLRRHQPRGHQGAGVLHHRRAVARAARHPGISR